jgi:uncharacterized membrane protein
VNDLTAAALYAGVYLVAGIITVAYAIRYSDLFDDSERDRPAVFGMIFFWPILWLFVISDVMTVLGGLMIKLFRKGLPDPTVEEHAKKLENECKELIAKVDNLEKQED